MGEKVREVKPTSDTANLDELIVEEVSAPASNSNGKAPAGRPPGEAPTVVRLVEHRRPLTANDLGPNGEAVLEFLSRAGRLTADECHRLEQDATWRWGLAHSGPGRAHHAGRSRSGARPGPRRRPLRCHRGTRDGGGRDHARLVTEADALAPLRVHLQCRPGRPGPRPHRHQTFDVLFGPWLEVMHH